MRQLFTQIMLHQAQRWDFPADSYELLCSFLRWWKVYGEKSKRKIILL